MSGQGKAQASLEAAAVEGPGRPAHDGGLGCDWVALIV